MICVFCDLLLYVHGKQPKSYRDGLSSLTSLFLGISELPVLKGSPITNAVTCMKIYLYKQNGNFVKETDTLGYIVV